MQKELSDAQASIQKEQKTVSIKNRDLQLMMEEVSTLKNQVSSWDWLHSLLLLALVTKSE
jgi:hypothetical protein